MIAREKPPPGDADRADPAQSSAGWPDKSSPETSESDVGPQPSPFDPLLRHLAELQMLVGHYLRARTDQITASLRTIVFWAIAGLIGLIIAVALLATAVVLVLQGIAAGLARLGLQPWAADLITGIVCIAVVGAGIAIASASQKRAARRKRRDDYEHFRARYRAKFGHSLDETGGHGK
jgi:hypothetical protein